MDHDAMGHGNHMAHMGNLKLKFIISLLLAIPIIILSPMMGWELPFQFTFPGSEWVVLVLATVLFFYGGWPFLVGAKEELRQKAPAMMTLISLGISVAYLYSVYAFVENKLGRGTHVMDFFWELATLIVIMLLGHWVEMNAIGSAGNALQKLAELLPGSATVIQPDGSVSETALQEVRIGMKVLVKPGGKIPADGTVKEGSSTVNEAMVTGESREVSKNPGDKVIGGAVNGSGSLTVEVSGTGKSGYLAQVMQLVASAQQEKSRAETLSDRVARLLFYVALAVGVVAFVVWYWLSMDINIALERMVTVLIIACPHALGLAVPLVVARSTSLGARHGLLFRKRQALETATKVNAVLMDKTGTLTEGRFSVSRLVSFDANYDENAVLQMISALEQHSNHPLSIGILREAKKRDLTIPQAEKVENIPGSGLKGIVNGEAVQVVSAAFLRKNNIAFDEKAISETAAQGDSASFLMVGGKAAGLVAQGDQMKQNAAAAILKLKSQNIKTVMLTGDNQDAAKSVAGRLHLDDVRAELLPQDKEHIVRQYNDEGFVTMMVGDGVNDAPSLVRAGVGVAIGAGTDVAVESADVVLVRSDPADIPALLDLAKNTSKKMLQNLWWGAGYNIVAIPLAAGVLAHWGIVLSPALGAILMSLSTIIVAVNAMTLRMSTNG